VFPYVLYAHIAFECEASSDHGIPTNRAFDHTLIVTETVALKVTVAVIDILAQGMGARLTVFPAISVVR